MQMPVKCSLALLVALVAATTPALADISAAGGIYATNTPAQTGAAVLISSGQSIPALPIEIQGTLLVPVTKQGGYALTAEIRGLSGGGFGGAYIGGGIGVGTLARDHTVGPVVTLFAGKPIAPFTTIELRVYVGTRDTGTTAGFLGVRFSI